MELARLIARMGALAQAPRYAATDILTPLERLGRLGEQLGHDALYAKRDDCHGLGLGGNKTRQLEYYFGDAMAKGADTILITGAVQSNFARLAAAFCAKAGMECHIQHEPRVDHPTDQYGNSGNVLLERLFGARFHQFGSGEDEAGADEALEKIADALRRDGRTPYVIHLSPGHPPIGSLGYAYAAAELLHQARRLDLAITEIVLASGSGATHAGMLFGLRALESDIKVTGSCVRRASDLQRARIVERCQQIAALLRMECPVRAEDVVLDDSHLAPGYGIASPTVMDAIITAARTEALIVDPTYTGKAMSTFLDRAKATAGTDSCLMFLHTGGTPSVFAYEPELARHAIGSDRT